MSVLIYDLYVLRVESFNIIRMSQKNLFFFFRVLRKKFFFAFVPSFEACYCDIQSNMCPFGSDFQNLILIAFEFEMNLREGDSIESRLTMV